MFKDLPLDPKNTVIIMDKHASHQSYDVCNYLEKIDCLPLFLPTNTCGLNSVERCWSLFKRELMK